MIEATDATPIKEGLIHGRCPHGRGDEMFKLGRSL
jgi:hypothetical protein